MDIEWAIPSSKREEGLRIGLAEFEDVVVSQDLSILAESEKKVFEEIRKKYTRENLKNSSLIRAYRDFYWKWKIADPTKVRPASEALIRRILIKDNIWRINTFVNAYNLASALTGVSLGAYDKSNVNLPLNIRFAKLNEEFWGIGMKKSKSLSGVELVLADQNGILCIFPYRDSEKTKISLKTKRAYVVAFGVPGISAEDLRYSLEKASEIIEINTLGKLCSISFS